MEGALDTVKLTPLLACPFTVTITFPVAALAGTVTVMLVGDHAEAIGAALPLKVTVLEPWLAPKLAPLIVTELPLGPADGDRFVMLGAPDAEIVYVAVATALSAYPAA